MVRHIQVRLYILTLITLPSATLDDQTQVVSKPAGQPEHTSLNQCQLIAANMSKIGALGTLQLVVEIRFLSNLCESPDWSLFPRDLALMAYLVLLA